MWLVWSPIGVRAICVGGALPRVTVFLLLRLWLVCVAGTARPLEAVGHVGCVFEPI